MFEAKLAQGGLLKKVISSIQDLVADANWDCNDVGIALQAMDTAHVALVALLLRSDGFEPYRCDRNITLGINVQSLAKILKCAGNEDAITLAAADEGNLLSLMFEGKNERVSEYDLKLLDIDADQLGIPDTQAEATVEMSSAEFQRICRDLSMLGESITISVNKESIGFFASGDIGNGSIVVKQNVPVDGEDESTVITMDSPVSLVFSSQYLNQFAKATSLSKRVTLSLSSEAPLLIEYKIDELGYLRFYLASKIGDDEGEEDMNE